MQILSILEKVRNHPPHSSDMPALLGYLIAVVVFLGSGYAGLEWLTSPDDPIKHPSDNNSPNGGPKKHAGSIATTKEAAPSVADKNTTREEAKASDSGGEISKKPDPVPTGGCMPIGLTANGEMVFPLQCRELLATSSRCEL
jgi:hypothetical protein